MNNIFKDLFVLELANNHLGSIERGKKIIAEFSKITSTQNIKTAIKLQFRDGENFVQKDFQNDSNNLYINKVLNTKMSPENYGILAKTIKDFGHITIATPFDEKSVDTCLDLDIDIIKIASANIDDWHLINKIAEIRKPVIISTGGTTTEMIDEIIEYFDKQNIPTAINHCVSIYPSKPEEMELNQIDFLKNRYPNHIIGFSTHEYNNSTEDSMLIAYAKGARLFERHINPEKLPLGYCSTPDEIKKWIEAYKKAKILCGNSAHQKITPLQKEIDYIDSFKRGVYMKKNVQAGQTISEDDIYFAIPLQEGQLSAKEFKNNITVSIEVFKDKALMKTFTELKHEIKT